MAERPQRPWGDARVAGALYRVSRLTGAVQCAVLRRKTTAPYFECVSLRFKGWKECPLRVMGRFYHPKTTAQNRPYWILVSSEEEGGGGGRPGREGFGARAGEGNFAHRVLNLRRTRVAGTCRSITR